MRVIATLTTIPSRYDTLYQTIVSLSEQTRKLDAIYVGIPKISRRLQKPYPAMPIKLLELCTIVELEEDYGPICKILGGIYSENDPETIIISFDDDVIVPKDFVEKVVILAEEYPDTAFAGTGSLFKHGFFLFGHRESIDLSELFNISFNWLSSYYVPEEGRRVDLLFGVAGIVYRRDMFPETRKELYNKLLIHTVNDDDIFHNDDIIISAYLGKEKVVRKVFKDIPRLKIINGEDALSADFTKMLSRAMTAFEKCKVLGYFQNLEDQDVGEALTLRWIVLILFIILIILTIWGLYKFR